MFIRSKEAEFKRGVEIFSSKLEAAFSEILRQAAADAEHDLRESLSHVGSVVEGERQSSPPYGAPYKVSGALAKASGVDFAEEGGKIAIKIGTDINVAPYAVYLEYGGARMKARPYLLPCGRKCFEDINVKMRDIKGKI